MLKSLPLRLGAIGVVLDIRFVGAFDKTEVVCGLLLGLIQADLV